MGEMRESDWSRKNLLRSDRLVLEGASYTTAIRTGPVHRRVFAMTYGIKSLLEIYMKFKVS